MDLSGRLATHVNHQTDPISRPIKLFPVPATAPQMSWDGVYKRSLAANWQELTMKWQ